MIRLVKEIYLTAFVIIFRLSRAKDIAYRAGGAIAVITVVECLILIGISGYLEKFLGKTYLISKPIFYIGFFAIVFVNGYFLFFRGNGIKFNQEFDGLEKSRRVVLVVSCALLVMAAIAFFIYSAIARRHFTGAN
jgi:energy-coupling factor transporter transmembrane protein EcfT